MGQGDSFACVLFTTCTPVHKFKQIQVSSGSLHLDTLLRRTCAVRLFCNVSSGNLYKNMTILPRPDFLSCSRRSNISTLTGSFLRSPSKVVRTCKGRGEQGARGSALGQTWRAGGRGAGSRVSALRQGAATSTSS